MTPSVDVLIATHARVSWLEEALFSALQQDYAGVCRVVVFNDCPEQRLTCADPRVRVVNVPERFQTLGQKRNAMMLESSADWLAFLDDDDILLPHINRASSAVDAGQRTSAASHKYWFVGDQGSVEGPSIMDFLVDRKHAIRSGGFPSLDNRDEHGFMDNLAKLEPIYRENNRTRPSYLYIWGNGVHHVSGTGAPDAGLGFRADALSRLNSGIEPSGDITLTPRFNRDYFALAADALDRHLRASNAP